MIKALWAKGWTLFLKEWKTAARFFVVGGSSFLVKAGVYVLLSRVLWVHGSASVENAIALVVAVLYNYTLHRLWTFREHGAASGTFGRYLVVVVSASFAEAGLFYLLHERFGIYDILVLVMDTFLIAGFTFAFHRLFTFHSNPWKRPKSPPDVVQS